jgi:hypothetical protein
MDEMECHSDFYHRKGRASGAFIAPGGIENLEKSVTAWSQKKAIMIMLLSFLVKRLYIQYRALNLSSIAKS